MEESGDLAGRGRGGRRRNQYDRDWTKGSIVGNLLALGWPMIVSGSLNMIGPTIDMIWVGRLGASAIAGVGVAGMIVMLVQSMIGGLYQGLRSMVARYIGAGDRDQANHIVQQVFVIDATCAVIMALIGIFLAKPILILMGVGADVVDQGTPYLRINFIGMVSMSLRMVTEAAMQASGDSSKPMWVAVFFRLFHVILSPFLIFGWWIFPQLGVTGAAITNVFSQGIGAALGLWFLFSGRTRLKLTFRNFRLDGKAIWRIIKIGFPASIMGMEQNLANLILIWLMTPYGTVAVAGHTLNQRVSMFVFVPAMGLGQAAGVLAGQSLGAGQPERAVRTGWLGTGLLSVMMLFFSGAILLWAEYIIRIFSSDPSLVEMSSAFIRIAATGFLLVGFNTALQQCISGAGDTLPPMLITLLNLWLIQLPLAFILSRYTPLGVYGVRWAMAAGGISAAIAYVIYYQIGRWKRIRVW